jgi:20S proteasome alpha/beta subunit
MPDGSFAHPQERQFNPYTSNGGTILAIAGADFSVVAGDTRQSEGYSIQTRYAPKVFRLYVYCAIYALFPLNRSSQNQSRCPGR